MDSSMSVLYCTWFCGANKTARVTRLESLRIVRKNALRHTEHQPVCKLAGVRDLRIHDLRRFAATTLFLKGTRLGEAGSDAFTIAALMGHGRIETTRRYVRATERNKRAAVRAAMLGS